MTQNEWDHLKSLPIDEFVGWTTRRMLGGAISPELQRALIRKRAKELDQWSDDMLAYARQLKI